MAEQLSKTYEPKAVEALASDIWSKGNYFHADPNAESAKGNYCIVIPPPNVTAALHLGHALNNTLQDVLIRFRRMQGYNTLWMPGTDHAGIATQTVVEKRLLAEEGKRRTEYDREDFVGRVQDWKDEYEARILGQLKSMGCSCDWDRTRFTMDEVCAKAVRANFFKLFKDGLIYRGKRLVNWDPATQTVLADDEVEHETVQGFFWYMQYPLVKPVEVDGEKIDHVTVATTRPETMLGDTAIAMNPKDPRADALVGQEVRLPIVGRIIKIVADDHVVLPDPESDDEKAKFSTGFLKVTPAHDPDDWQIGQRHDLEIINVMAPDGTISDKFGFDDAKEGDAEAFLGMDRFEAREAIVEWFRQEKLLENVRDYAHEVGHSYRSHVPIEPYLSDQWYVAVKKPVDALAEKFGTGELPGTDVPRNSLAGLALAPLLEGEVKFTPDRYTKTYQNWLENLRDWPISRQLWWGHRIPIWSSDTPLNEEVAGEHVEIQEAETETGEKVYYACVAPGQKDFEEQLEKLGWSRDEDVLDTWFSSALWPFSTLGWPEDTPELKTFYPGNVLCTAREIITLWVSRMVMMGQYCAGDIPFSDVYIHAMIQDGQGRKMSKSLGNGIDPLVAIDSHGADSMRFTLANMTTDTQDVRMPVESMKLPDGRTVNTSPKFDIGRNFCNKLWNACRFAMINLEDVDAEAFEPAKMRIEDKWILSRLARTAKEVTEQIEEFKYSEPLTAVYKFFWNDFCDWYLEWIKPRMRDDEQKPIAQNVLAFVLDQTLRLMHPFVPFITEGMFQKLNEYTKIRKLKELVEAVESDALIVAAWPEGLEQFVDDAVESDIEMTQEVIRAIRDIRNKYAITPKETVDASASAGGEARGILTRNANLICEQAGLSSFEVTADAEKPNNAASSIAGEVQVYVHDVVDPEEERKRLMKQKEHIEKGLKGSEAKLNNENFVNRAKPEVVQQARERYAELKEQLATIEKHLEELQ
ncbi:Valine--tRNA ligase [Anaerohalosphaera lusitana]|uniref:Valine--tRNA ligase n=1 Tax=Anaerohalosphaera lusitana TaxID=1936003 RepID=A0A1U9NPK3_9BACT|nr:valine--tRNA ligase [Anaerohalosphaera lusitana]AQT69717.1 Valine--tRNA ligase [Anaerohalosphaera lusitana]